MINITYFYIVENIDNDPNKIYIGKTVNPKLRIRDHKKTYGSDIQFTIIDEAQTSDRSYWKPIETMLIQTFISWGFNVVNTKRVGGGGVEFHSEESKRKASESNKGKIFSNNHKLNISKAKKGIIPTHLYKPIIQWSINGEFVRNWESTREAAEFLKVNKRSLTNQLLGREKSIKGFKFTYKIQLDIAQLTRTFFEELISLFNFLFFLIIGYIIQIF
jgi:hypothetical protein